MARSRSRSSHSTSWITYQRPRQPGRNDDHFTEAMRTTTRRQWRPAVLSGGNDDHFKWYYNQGTCEYTKYWTANYEDVWKGRPVLWTCFDLKWAVHGGVLCAAEHWTWSYI